MSRFINNLYTKEIIVFKNHQHSYLESGDGTLFSGQRKTKILAQGLPGWYVYGRYYKRWGYPERDTPAVMHNQLMFSMLSSRCVISRMISYLAQAGTLMFLYPPGLRTLFF